MENTTPTIKPYPNLKQAFILLLALLGINVIVSIPLIILFYVLTKSMNYNPLMMLSAYSLTFALIILFGWWQKSRFLQKKYAFPFARAPLFIYPLALILTLCVLFIIDPLLNLIPMPDFLYKMFVQMFADKSWPTFVLMSIAAPIFEEMIFRGIILDGFLKIYSPKKAIIWSSVIFGIAHFNPWQFIGALIIGAFIGWLYWKTHSLLPGIFVHFVANTTSFVTSLFIDMSQAKDLTTRQLIGNNLLYFSLLAASIIISIFLLRYLDKHIKPEHEYMRRETL